METTIEGAGKFPSDDEINRNYRILEMLGRGGMGEVYLAEQLRVGRRRVALKLIRPPHRNDPEMIRRFENEASIAGRLDYENIVKIHDCRSTSDGRPKCTRRHRDHARLAHSSLSARRRVTR